jgi:HAD superfamily hydrolase (TIGR01509 family)
MTPCKPIAEPIRKIKAIFWDNDGVLVDTEHLYFLATRQVLESVGVSLSEEQYIDLFLRQGTGAFHLAAERNVSPEGIAHLRQERNEIYSALLSSEPLIIDGVREVLEALHGKYMMGIVTSSRQDHFELIHRNTGLLPYFQFTLTASDYTHFKPDPEPYLKAVERSGFQRHECLVVEDSERGLTAATAAGLRCIVVPSGFTHGGRFIGAYKVLSRLSQLPSELMLI